MKTLLIGADGQIGWELQRALELHAEVVPFTIADLDLTDVAAIRRRVREIQPDLILNAAGYTAVDRAESEPELAKAINATAVGVLGEEAKRLGAAMIHFSTDYVFDGRKNTPYLPEDPPNPLSVYGQSKLDGDLALTASGVVFLIIRTSWVYGLRGRNFLLAMIHQAGLKKELRVVNDQTGSPTWSHDLARATVQIITQSLTGESGHWSFGGREGLYHLANRGAATWFEFAQRIFQLADIQPKPVLTPITTDQYVTAARRPRYSVLDCSKTFKTFDVLMPQWDQALQEALSGDRTGTALAAPTRSGDAR